MGNGFAGVEIPNYDAPTNSDPKGEESTQSTQTEAVETQTTEKSDLTQAPELTDLEKLERFRFSGREYTPSDFKKEWESGVLRHSDYTKKTQELAETRKYAENFHVDLDQVIANPQLLDKMREIYPKQYVAAAEKILSRLSKPEDGSSPSPSKLPPEMEAALGEIREWKQEVQEQTIAATKQQLDSLHETLGKKYPYADPDVVDVRLQYAIDKGEKITRENISKIIENAYKSHNEAVEKRINSLRKAKVEEQVKAGKEARDIGPGGAIPSAPRTKPKKWADIEKNALAAFEGK